MWKCALERAVLAREATFDRHAASFQLHFDIFSATFDRHTTSIQLHFLRYNVKSK